jgi:hypothetical protein
MKGFVKEMDKMGLDGSLSFVCDFCLFGEGVKEDIEGKE